MATEGPGNRPRVRGVEHRADPKDPTGAPRHPRGEGRPAVTSTRSAPCLTYAYTFPSDNTTMEADTVDLEEKEAARGGERVESPNNPRRLASRSAQAGAHAWGALVREAHMRAHA